MQAPELPANEEARLAGLRDLDVLDTPAEERFDRITRVAKFIFGVPIALISLVDEKRQWFKSRQGLTAWETAREISFCGHAILADEPLIVTDASKDERFHDNPLVKEAPNIRFYAGYPLRDRDGNALGTLCLIDQAPRELEAEHLKILEDLALTAQDELNFVQLGLTQLGFGLSEGMDKRKGLLDSVTGLWNRVGIMEILDNALEACQRKDRRLSMLLVRIEDLSNVETSGSEQGGDIVLSEIAQVLRGCLRPHDTIGRLGTDEFLILEYGTVPIGHSDRARELRESMAQNPVLASFKALDFSISSSAVDVHADTTADELVLELRNSLRSGVELRPSA